MGYTLFLTLLLFTCYVLLVVFISFKFKRKHVESTSSSNRPSSLSAPLTSIKNDKTLQINVAREPLQLQITNEIDRKLNILSSETIILNPIDGDNYKFAFYMAVDGERQDVRWYESNPRAEFKLPAQGAMVEITAFVADNEDKKTRKVSRINIGNQGSTL